MSRSVMLSVIVPVYKVEIKYLSECFESILAQEFKDYELIIVDDGAPTDIAGFIDSYDFRDAVVRIIRQENRGVASARNTGIEAAAGRYITFVDSDDTITAGCFDGITGFAEKNGLDVLMWGIRRTYGDKKVEFSPYLCDITHFSEQQKEEVQFKCLVGILPFYVCPPASADAAGSACAKLYRREFLGDGIRYTEGLKRAEDMEFNLRVFGAAEHIGYLYKFYYDYRQISTSATYTYRDRGLDVFTESLAAIRTYLESSGKEDLFFQVYYMRCMFFYLESMDMDHLNPNNPKPLRQRIRELGEEAGKEPYAEAFAKLRGDHLTFARKIPLFLIRHRMFYLLAAFYSVFRMTRKG